MSTQPCPFCSIMLPDDPQMWNLIGADFFGTPAKVGDVPSCDDCAASCAWLPTDDLHGIVVEALSRPCSLCDKPTTYHCTNAECSHPQYAAQCPGCALQTDMGPHCNWCEAELVEEKAEVTA